MITHSHDSAGWALVLFVAFALAFSMVIHWIRIDLKTNGRRCRDVMRHPSHRLMAGTSMIFGGAMVQLAIALPRFPLQAARQWGWWRWWSETAEWGVATGALLIVGGLVVMMWPALHHRFGWATLLVVGAGVGCVYAVGVAATEVALWAI